MADDHDDLAQKALALIEWRIRSLEKTVEALTAEMRREFVNAKEFADLKVSLEKANEKANAARVDRRDHFTAPIVTGLVVATVLFVAEHVWPVAAAVRPH